MRRRRHASTAMLILVMLLLSAGVHLLLWPLGNHIIQLEWEKKPVPRVKKDKIEVALIDVESLVEPEFPGRLVTQDRAINQLTPKDTKNIAEFDQSVDRETRAPNRPRRLGSAFTNPSVEQKTNQLQQGKPSPTSSPGNPGTLGKAPGEQVWDADRKDEEGIQSKQEGVEGKTQASPAEKLNFYGSSAQMRQLFGSQGSFDAIDDVEEGEENLLNSRRWKYASFFNRVRDAIAREWDPVSLHAARDPTGQVYGTATRTTRLFIRLNPDGSVSRVVVDRSSKVPFLDEEAIRAVWAAQPFRNPPPQLVDPKTGFIDFHFGFILDIHGKGRIFRYQR